MNSHDLFSEIVSSLRVVSEVYFMSKLRGDYSIGVEEESKHIRFHLVKSGSCIVTTPDSSQIELFAGDMILIPNGIPHVISSSKKDIQTIPLSNIAIEKNFRDGELCYGEGSIRTKMLCGFYRFEEAIEHPIIRSLPDYIVLPDAHTKRCNEVSSSLNIILAEAISRSIGSDVIITKLLEVVFIQLLRNFTLSTNSNSKGFVAAMSDRKISVALSAIHEFPHKKWTIDKLAKNSGMSRARFAERFTAVIGTPPISYLTTWRLTKAKLLLTDSILSIEKISSICGYESTPSFSARFKKVFNVGPGEYRKSFKMIKIE